MLNKSAIETLQLVGMVMWLIFGASYFAAIYQGLGLNKFIQDLFIESVNKWAILLTIQIMWLLLGCLMDALSILMITAPIFLPVINALGLDPVWFAMLYAVNTELAYLTPPFGVNLFVMKGIMGDRASMGLIYRAVLPFLIIQALGLLIVMVFPKLITWIPNIVFG
jgi:TRAP-type C4-dicarboxylate transport system permease large subunit